MNLSSFQDPDIYTLCLPDGREIKARFAISFWERLLGFMFRKNFKKDEALIFSRCNAVHTCFMRTNLEVYFLDKKGKTVKSIPNLRPWRIAFHPSASSVVEIAR